MATPAGQGPYQRGAVRDAHDAGLGDAGQAGQHLLEFFKSLTMKAGMNLHVRMLYGQNGHHLEGGSPPNFVLRRARRS